MVFIDVVVIFLVNSFDHIVLRLIVFTIVLHLEHRLLSVGSEVPFNNN
jgi:hypothetical protein